jgi:hypothetical protein
MDKLLLAKYPENQKPSKNKRDAKHREPRVAHTLSNGG